MKSSGRLVPRPSKMSIFCTKSFKVEYFFTDEKQRCYDGQMPPNFASLERAREVRDNVVFLNSQIKSCNVFIMTLGLVEAWYDNVANLYLNLQPGTSAARRNPGRFCVRVLDYAENMKIL